MPGWGLIIIVVIAAALLFFNFVPFIIALLRGHRNSTAIFVLSLFLGWTIIGWIIALVWSFTESKPRVIERRR